ncbi:MAG: hypothetical protein RJQ01_03065 [Microcella sp.]|uniref:hypothetical protein n=1 Tax=Microcella sp. TaxID=1913979 RepID=UPI003315402E
MGGLTAREALGGPWATHWAVWVSLYPPTTLLVILRENITPFAEWWWPLLSATLQHLAVGIIIALGAAIARRRHAILPLTVVAAIWGTAAVSRAVIGGFVANAVTGVDPEYAFRIATWVTASALWVPIFVYTLAQLDQRRLLLGALDAAHRDLERARHASIESADEVQRNLRESVRHTVEPVLEDLRVSLSNTGTNLTRPQLEQLTAQLGRLHDDVAAVVDSAGVDPRASQQAHQRASLRRAFDVRPERPVLTALLVTVATIALIAPDAWRVFGAPAALEVTIAAVVSGVFLGIGPAVAVHIGHSVSVFPGQAVTVVSLVLALGAMTQIMLASEIDPITWHGLLIAPLMAVSLILTSTVFALATALYRLNEDAGAELAQTRTTIEALDRERAETRRRERRKLAILLHGPIQGRLAACVMALNFHTAALADGSSAGPTSAVIDAVALHLDDVSLGLVSLATMSDADGLRTPEQG